VEERRDRWIDGRVSPRTGTSEQIVLTHYPGTRRGCAWCGNTLFLLLLKNLTLGGTGFSDNVSLILVGDESWSLFPCDDKRD